MRRNKLYSISAFLVGSLASGSVLAQDKLNDTEWIKPMMMLLVDTSGSMEKLPTASGQTSESLPNCASTNMSLKKSRWTIAVEALGGVLDGFSCTPEDRKGASYLTPLQYDYGYFLPHHKMSFTTQRKDGILDQYEGQVKFGIMTFDGVMTTSDAPGFVPFTSYTKGGVYGNSLMALAGMYSYPDESAAHSTTLDTPVNAFGWKPLAFPGCDKLYGMNAGVRRESKGDSDPVPGAMISFGDNKESVEELGAVNANIKKSLLSVRPFGGTPTAAMLDDFRYYMRNHPDVKNDRFYECRKRQAILLTDGAPDALYRSKTYVKDARYQCDILASDPNGATLRATCPVVNGTRVCQCPYDTEVNLVNRLIDEDGLGMLHVVAFSVPDAEALNQLNLIAQAGSKKSTQPRDAIQATNMSQLRDAIDSILSEGRPQATSRTVPAIANGGKTVTLGGVQYQITAGFRVGKTDKDYWQGRLFRQRTGCTGATPSTAALDENAGDMFHETLNDRSASDRSIQTIAPDADKVSGSLYAATQDPNAWFQSKVNVVRPDGTNFTTAAPAASAAAQGVSQLSLASFTKFDAALSQNYFRDANKNGTNYETADRDAVVAYVRGSSSTRTGAKLGDIYHSNPLVLPPLVKGSADLTTYDPRLNAFYNTLLASSYGTDGRPGVVFVATNDGLLHAFNLDKWTSKGGTVVQAGEEMWGFVPPALFGTLNLAATMAHYETFDGSPVVKDVIVATDTTPATMKTVLVIAVRGAPAYVALDVTTPESPKFLWQRSFPNFGKTVATPAIAQVNVKWGTGDQTRAVAILPGGAGTQSTTANGCTQDVDGRGLAPNSARTQVRCWNTPGRALYVVDIATGATVQEFDARHFASPLTGSVAIDGESLGLTRAAYLTDADGVLWRLSMRSNDPSKWRVAPIWDLFAGSATAVDGGTLQPAPTPAWDAGRVATYPPMLTRNPSTGNMTILVGTGDIDNLVDVRTNRIVSLEETRKVENGELGPGTMTANWALQLAPYESVTGPMLVLDDHVYFTTFKGPAPGTSKCSMGESKIVGVHVRTKQGPTSGLPKAAPLVQSPNGCTVTSPSCDIWYYPTSAKTDLLVGLSMARAPVCVTAKNADPNATSGMGRVTSVDQAGGGAYQLRTNVAGTGGSAMTGSGTAGDAQRQLTQTLPVSNSARSVGWASSIE